MSRQLSGSSMLKNKSKQNIKLSLWSPSMSQLDVREKLATLYLCVNDLLSCSEIFSISKFLYETLWLVGTRRAAQMCAGSHSKWLDHNPNSGSTSPCSQTWSLLVFQNHLEFKAVKAPGNQSINKYILNVYCYVQDAVGRCKWMFLASTEPASKLLGWTWRLERAED